MSLISVCSAHFETKLLFDSLQYNLLKFDFLAETLEWRAYKDCKRPHAWFGSVSCSDKDVLVIGGQTDDINPRAIRDKESPMLLFDSSELFS
jgi:hypothetical protein